MPQVHFVKKARKDNPAVKKGQPYWWWRTRTTVGKSYVGRKHYSATRPRASRVTSNEYYSTCYGHMETITEDLGSIDSEAACEDAVSQLESVKDEIESYKDEIEERRDAVGAAFNDQGDAFETLEQRVEALETLIDTLDSAISELYDLDWPEEPDEEEDEDEEEGPWVEYQAVLQDTIAEAQGVIDGIDWTFE